MRTEQTDKIIFVDNKNGPRLGYCLGSGVRLLRQDGLCFKDLSGSGTLLPYEDWRLTAEDRAADLAKRLSIEQIAGLMVCTLQQAVPFLPFGLSSATYDGKPFEESGKDEWEMTDQQLQFFSGNVRHVSVTALKTPEIAAKWVNRIQAYVEGRGMGIPVSIASDPRHGVSYADVEFINTAQGTSIWPQGLAMAATFDPALCRRFGEVVSEEYRAMGITVAFHPQADLATEPRWLRFGDTFGEHPQLTADLCRAYCDGLQTTENSDSGWGTDSVVAMVKHWPGGGPCESGRDAHYVFGKYAVYPGNQFKTHLYPFVEGAFRLDGPTKKAAAVMPYFSVAVGQDRNGEAVGNAFSSYLIQDLLRGTYGYDGVVCTDFCVTEDNTQINSMSAKDWGVESLSVAQRHLKAILAGCDQFGGSNETGPIIAAYRIGCELYGETFMRRRFEASARRLLLNMFRCGLFENPYLDPARSKAVVGRKALVEEGMAALRRSIVLMKNKGQLLPLLSRKKVYIPPRHIAAHYGFFRTLMEEQIENPVEDSLLLQYFDKADCPEEADLAIVFISTPITDPYSEKDLAAGGTGYLPISLQYRPYTAYTARRVSLAGGDPQETFVNRSYRGKTVCAANEQDLDLVLEMRQKMGDRPVIVVNEMNGPTIPGEFEPFADAVIGCFCRCPQAVLDIVRGLEEPSGLLPFCIPKDMQEVEQQQEDVPFDMEPYQDCCGNFYNFGFGMNWAGIIRDKHQERYQIRSDSFIL